MTCFSVQLVDKILEVVDPPLAEKLRPLGQMFNWFHCIRLAFAPGLTHILRRYLQFVRERASL